MKLRKSKIQNLKDRIVLFKDWWKVTPPYNRYYNRKPEHYVTLRNGEVFQVRGIFEYDLPIIDEIFGRDAYHLRDLKLPECAVVFDVGAHIGTFSVAIHFRHKDAIVTAFEPHPDNFKYLQKNAPFAECINKAVAGTVGMAHLQDHVASSAYSLGDTGIVVQTVLLSSYISAVPRVDLLKIDVEGAEKGIFESLSPQLLKKVDRIIMEVHQPHEVNWFISLLENAGFIVTMDNDNLFAVRESPSA